MTDGARSFSIGLVGLVFALGFVALVVVFGSKGKNSYHHGKLPEAIIWSGFKLPKYQDRLTQSKASKSYLLPVRHLRHW